MLQWRHVIAANHLKRAWLAVCTHLRRGRCRSHSTRDCNRFESAGLNPRTGESSQREKTFRKAPFVSRSSGRAIPRFRTTVKALAWYLYLFYHRRSGTGRRPGSLGRIFFASNKGRMVLGGSGKVSFGRRIREDLRIQSELYTHSEVVSSPK